MKKPNILNNTVIFLCYLLFTLIPLIALFVILNNVAQALGMNLVTVALILILVFVIGLSYIRSRKKVQRNRQLTFEATESLFEIPLENILDPETLKEIRQSEPPTLNDSITSDEEFEELEVTILKLRDSRQYQESLQICNQAICLAHQSQNIFRLVNMLDRRVEILCFASDFPKALRTLVAQEYYLHRSNYKSFLKAWFLHTRGMVYMGCGWWEKATIDLRESIQIMEDLGEWDEWARSIGDFATFTLRQAQAEAPEPSLLKESCQLLDSARNNFRFHNSHLMILAYIHSLMIRNILAVLENNGEQLKQIWDEFYSLMLSNYGWQEDPQLLLNWTIGICRNECAKVDLAIEVNDFYSPLWHVQQSLDPPQSLLETALLRAPNVPDLWHQKAVLHLCRARCQTDTITEILAASGCMEKTMDIWRSHAVNYTAPQVRAGWLSSANHVLEDLASTATLALDPPQTVHLNSPMTIPLNPVDLRDELSDIANRMLSMAQYLRSRSRQDLVRSSSELNQAPEIKELITRIRYLNRWLDRLNAFKTKNFDSLSYNRNRVTGGQPAPDDDPIKLLNLVAEEILNKYPKYSRLETRGLVEEESARCIRELDELVVRNTALRMQSEQLKSEAPYDISTLQMKLQENEFVLDYYIGPSKLHVGIFSRNGLQILPLPISNIRDLHKVAKELLPESAGSLAKKMQQCSEWLFPQNLVDFLNENKARHLYIVPSGPLWRIPFPWLNINGKIALETWEISLVPSARLAGDDKDVKLYDNTFAVGHSGGNLKNIEEEVNQVGDLLGAKVIFEGEATPQGVLREVLPNADVVHFACHGWADPISALTSSLLLEADEEHPDGRLLLHEMLSTKLQATLISLGSCHTAKSEGPLSFPESLAHVLLGMGARFVVASLWEADDQECLNFNRYFYNALKDSLDPVVAFKQAQLERLYHSSSYDSKGYASIKDEDFALLANFVLLSASKD